MNESFMIALKALDDVSERQLASGERVEILRVASLIGEYALILQHAEELDSRFVKSLCRIAMLLRQASPGAKGSIERCLVVAADVLEQVRNYASAPILEQLLRTHLTESKGRFSLDSAIPADLSNAIRNLNTALDHIKELIESRRPQRKYSGACEGIAYSLPSLAERARESLAKALDMIRRPTTVEAAQDTICSVFAPEHAAPDSTVLIQVWLHAIESTKLLTGLSKEVDSAARSRGSSSLFRCGDGFVIVRIHVPRGATGAPARQIVRVRDHSLITSGNTGSSVKQSHPSAATFSVTIEPGFSGPLVCRISVSRTGRFAEVPVGSVAFKILVDIGATALSGVPLNPTVRARRYRTAFVSYARHDLSEVIKRVQVLEALGIDFFQDFYSIRPREAWSEAILQNIENSELFLLFWSSAAAQSEYVRREINLAVKTNQRNGGQSRATLAL